MKRRSATSSQKPPSKPVFFVDRSLGRRIVVDALRAAGAIAEAHDDHFSQDTSDADWLLDVGRRGWVVLTKDVAIRRRPLERRALTAAKVRAFILTSRHLRGAEMAEIFVRHLDRIHRLVQTTPAPFMAKVTKTAVKLYDGQ